MNNSEKTINEHILRITGSANLPNGLEIGKRYILEIEADIYDISQRDNQDETMNLTYKAKQTGNTKILDNGKIIIKAESKKTRSQKMHGAIWVQHNMLGLTEPFEEYYDRIMRKMTVYIPEIISFLETKN